jgi:tripartite-type tricarboxylate transporter receptor subunit TctC
MEETMKRRTLLTGAAMLPLGLPLHAQEAYPSRPITMIVPFPPGGVADITGRPTAHVMGKLL